MMVLFVCFHHSLSFPKVKELFCVQVAEQEVSNFLKIKKKKKVSLVSKYEEHNGIFTQIFQSVYRGPNTAAKFSCKAASSSP